MSRPAGQGELQVLEELLRVLVGVQQGIQEEVVKALQILEERMEILRVLMELLEKRLEVFEIQKEP